jgi:hypothetical protein
MLEFCVGRPKPALAFALFSKVVHKDSEQSCSRQIDFADNEVHRETAAILALAESDDPSLAGRRIAFQRAIVLSPIGRRQQNIDFPAHHLLRPVAKQAYRRCAKGMNEPLLVDYDRSVRDGLQN